MDNTNPNQPAFPFTTNTSVDSEVYEGLSKREYIAALAMQGIIGSRDTSIYIELPPDTVAEKAIAYADALLNQLNTKP